MNQTIDFLQNWNGKLFCNAFTTIRKQDDRYQVGIRYDITLQDKWCGDAECVQVTQFTLDRLTESMAYLDTGFSKRETIELLQELYGSDVVNETFCYIVLHRITKDYHLNFNLYAEKSNNATLI